MGSGFRVRLKRNYIYRGVHTHHFLRVGVRVRVTIAMTNVCLAAQRSIHHELLYWLAVFTLALRWYCPRGKKNWQLSKYSE